MKIEELYRIYQEHPAIQTDTRKLKKGDLFFALKGPSFNGNEFAQKAIKTGAVYSIIDDENYVGDNTLLVTDVLQTLQALARYHRDQFQIPFIAITGSNGKTTTKELIHAVLSSHFKTYTTEGNLNNHIGVPLTILKIKNDAQFAIIEMGANHLKEIESYCKIANPTHGLITNCGKAHLEGFGGEEGVKKGKGELYDHLRENDGTVFLMNDYDYLKEMSSGIKTIITYGTDNADILGTPVSNTMFLEVNFSKGFDGIIKTQLVGNYNLPNVLAAVTIGKHFNVPREKIKSAIESFIPSNSRSQLIQKNSNTIILDAYNANPSSMKLAIENFAKSKSENKILVLGAMAELGKESLNEHESIVNEIKKYDWEKVILVGGDFLRVVHPFESFDTASDAGMWLKEQNLQHHSLLIKGSRSSGMEKVLEYI